MPFIAKMLCAAGVVLSLCSQPAAAATRSFFYPLGAAGVASGAQGGSSGILLPPTGNPAFQVNFGLPVDYQANGAVNVVLYLVTAGFPCNARIVPTSLRRTRLGSVQVDGLSGVNGGTPLRSFQSLAVVRKLITLQAGTGLAGQRAGDVLDLQVTRQADDATDTCGTNVFVEAVEIQYPVP